MKRCLARLGPSGIVALAAALGASGSVEAAITVLDQYYLGEADGPGAVDGSVPLRTTDSIGSLDLAAQSNTQPSVISTYTSNVSAGATAHTGSNLAIQFSNANGHAGGTDTLYSAPARATAATDNFGMEGWFKVTENHAPGIVAFNGNAFSNGFGLMVNQVGFSGTFSYQALYGGVSYLDSRVPVTLDSWVYMAMVRDSGVTSLYVNNTTPITPSNPFTLLPNPSVTPLAADAGFGIGGTALAGNPLVFSGGIDEVRVFTFAPGQFSTSDLLISQTPPPPPPPPLIVTLWNTNASGTFSDSPNWDNGVPDASKTPVFRRGASVSYTVTVSDSHQEVSDRLLVGSNRVTFAPGVEIFKTYTVENTTTAEDGRGIIIGELTADSAVVNTSLPSFSGAAATLGDAPRSRGTLNVTGGMFNVTGSDASNIEFIVGRKGAGILNVTGGATANVTADAALGEYTGATGTATVSGAGSTWTNGGDLHVGYSGHGTLNVTSGGQVSNANGYIGNQSGSLGTATVTGSGSVWTNGGNLNVGYSGHGTLNVSSGGQVTSAAGHIGNQSGSTGAVTVDGAGSTWTNSFGLDVGGPYAGASGTLNVTSGGQVVSAGGDISDNGTVSIDGTGSKWTDSSLLRVSGTLNVINGGLVSSTGGFNGTYVDNGMVSVSGASSTWTNDGSLYVGFQNAYTTGMLNISISGGGQVVSTDSYIGGHYEFYGLGNQNVLLVSGPGAVTVAGSGSKWTNTDALSVGDIGAGTLSTLTVTGGGQVSDADGYIGGSIVANPFAGTSQLVAANGLVSVSGTGSKWTNNRSLYVGYVGVGTLSITSGGQVSGGRGYVGEYSGSLGMATIDGAGSMWSCSGVLIVGDGASGTLNITNGGTVSVEDQLIVRSLGELHGNGFIIGNVQNGGLVSPGNSPGALHVSGNYIQTAVGKLVIELAGTIPGSQYDQLLITGSAALDGTLQVSLLSGFTPSSGNSFDLLTAASGIAGTFANQQLPLLAGGLVWNLSYGPNDVILSVGGVLGDYNHNGTVDAADYIVWRKTLGQTGAGLAADGNNNGSIESGDFDVWRAQFGQTAGSGAGVSTTAAVPEPATLVMLMFAVGSRCLQRSRSE